MKSMMLATAMATMATVLAAPVHAGGGAPGYVDVDTDFNHQLNSYGIHGARDYNAWMGKIVCERLRAGRDADAPASVRFLMPNLQRGQRDITQVQAWQFLGASVNTYCPDELPVMERAAEQH